MRDEITIRSVQHYLYCPHRWGLMEIERAWAENFFVTKANLLHERVHSMEQYRSRGKKVLTSVSIYHDAEEYQLFGVVDCLELSECAKGIELGDDGKKYKICIVEYKPSKPKMGAYRKEDLMQVFAQKICVDYIFGGSCRGEIYYADVKKRVSLPLEENFFQYDEELKHILKEMRGYLQRGVVPPISKGQICSGCSMKDVCMPSKRKAFHLRAEIEKIRSSAL